MRIDYWLLFGFFAQFLFFLRFLVQWIYSEYHKKTVVPIYFWYLSLMGSVAIMIYAYHLKDPVFFIGQVFVFFIYWRNLYLAKRHEGENEII
ncbi:MAG: lipid-A-disaccharide synthase N-terminal domain-containing protein [Patescibacteria group bacterium]